MGYLDAKLEKIHYLKAMNSAKTQKTTAMSTLTNVKKQHATAKQTLQISYTSQVSQVSNYYDSQISTERASLATAKDENTRTQITQSIAELETKKARALSELASKKTNEENSLVPQQDAVETYWDLLKQSAEEDESMYKGLYEGAKQKMQEALKMMFGGSSSSSSSTTST